MIESVTEITEISDLLRKELKLPVWNAITNADFFMKAHMLDTF